MSSSAGSVVLGGGDAPARTASAIVALTESVSHELKVEGYANTIGLLSVGKFIESGTFTVGGHSWRIRYYPHGWDSNQAGHISMALSLVDADSTDVKARYTFSLLDQSEGKLVPVVHIETVSPFSIKQKAWGRGKFIARKEFEESAYLKDDCFTVRCDITVFEEIRTVATTQFVAVPPSDMHRDFGRLLSAGKGTDVTFEIGDETISAHRYVLAARSSVFEAELFGPMKEKTATCVRIDDMEATVFKAMLHFIYTDALPEMDEGETVMMAQHLLVAADRYHLERLKLICEERLCNYIDTSTASTTLALAEQHSCHGLREACFKFLASLGNLKATMASDGFKHLRSSCPYILDELVANLAP